MSSIVRILVVPASSAGYVEDVAALQAGAVPPGDRYTAPALTPGFRAVREVAEAVSIGLVLDSGLVAWGDCVAGERGGRHEGHPPFRSQDGLRAVEVLVAPALEGRELGSFRELAALVDGLGGGKPPEEGPAPAARPNVAEPSRRALLSAPFRALRAASRAEAEPPADAAWLPEGRLHPAMRYGAGQALLAAVALDRGTTMAEVIAREWDLPLPSQAVPLHARCGRHWQEDADKMIVRRVASLPHGRVEDMAGQVGRDGGELARYIRWLRERIARLGGDDYRPAIHVDLQGALGHISDHQPGRMLGHIYGWHAAAGPYSLCLENPVLLSSREGQIEAMHTLQDYVRMRGLDVRLVAGQWAEGLEDIQAFLDAGAAGAIRIDMPELGGIHNSVDAVLACRAAGAAAFLGGNPAETDQSARAAVHVALATQPDLLQARPGLGVDEAISLAQNEMARALTTVALRAGSAAP